MYLQRCGLMFAYLPGCHLSRITADGNFNFTEQIRVLSLSSDDMMNSKIQKKSLADEVAGRIREQIITGTYQDGQQLPTEPELMKQFGVGRSSVREAVRILANSGLLRVQQGVGTFIQKHTGIAEPLLQRLKRSKGEELDEIRQLLEMKIAEKAALNRTARDIKKMRSALDKRTAAAKSGLAEECIQADIEFHTCIAEASGNDILADLYKSFAVQLKSWFMEKYKNVESFRVTTKLHEDLLKSIQDGDSKQAWAFASKIINK